MNAAVIGLNWWGRKIVGSLAGSERIRVVAGAARRRSRHEEFARSAGIALLDDYGQALADTSIDTVILCTPNGQHEQQVLAALQAGKQVFCEKPLSLSRDSAERMVAAAARAGVVLGIGHERRFDPAATAIAELVAAGAFGIPMHIEANWSHDILAKLSADDWRGSAQEAPAAAMTGMGVHLTDLFICHFGPVEAVCAQTARRVLQFPTGDVAAVLLRFASGATACLSVISATPYYCRYTVFGDRLWAEARDVAHPEHAGPTLLTTCARNGEPQTRTLDAIDAVRANLEAWADAVEGRAPYRFTDAERIGNVAVLEAIAAAAARGVWQTVHW